MVHNESHKKFLAVIGVIIAIAIVLAYVVFIYMRDHNGVRRYCHNNPSACMPTEYPGKVSK